MGRFSWAGRGRPNVIVVIVVVEGHVRHFLSGDNSEVVKYPIIKVTGMIRVQYCVVKVDFGFEEQSCHIFLRLLAAVCAGFLVGRFAGLLVGLPPSSGRPRR